MNVRKPRGRKASSQKPRYEAETANGTIDMNPRGFAFLKLEDDTADDLYIPFHLLDGIMDGDYVRVEHRKGRVEKLHFVRHGRTEVVGSVIAPGKLDLDPGIGSGVLDFTGAGKKNDCVILKLSNGTWKVSENLGKHNSPDAVYRRIMCRHQLAWKHEDKVDRDAVKTVARIKSSGRKPSRRVDLRAQPVLTIDEDHSMDLDDAVFADVDLDGAVRVYVHIADVAEHVAVGSPVDQAARLTPTSVYLPNKVRPMIPTVLSENILSLVPNQDRDVLTVEMRIDATGETVSVDVYESVIRSKQRISYKNAALVLSGDERFRLERPLLDSLRWLHCASTRIAIQRTMRGGVDGAMLGETRGGVPEDHIAHDLIEKLMVAANEAVANWMHERNISAVYRCHEAPSDEALDELEELVASYGVYSRLPRPVDPLAFAGFCKQIEMNRNMETLWDAVGRVLERAEYTVANDGHFGLGSERYLHFTSPLRRYADLTVHRQVKQYLNGNRTTLERNETLSPIAKHATITSSKSSKAERDARNIQNVMNFAEAAQTQGSVLDAHIVSVKSGSIKVRVGGDQPVMATIAAKNLPKGYTLDESRKELRKGDQTWRRGDSLHVSVENIPLFGGSIEVQISSRQSRGVEKTSRRRGR